MIVQQQERQKRQIQVKKTLQRWFAEGEGTFLGLLGVLGFSLTLPATRAAVPELGGTFVGLGRALVAAALAALLLLARRERLPERRHWPSLALVALGVVAGFPLLSALAMRSLPAAHGAILVGLLPAATALAAVLRGHEHPPRTFWWSCAAGVLAVLVFAATEEAGRPQLGDLLLLGAVALAALGYAEGGHLAKEIGGWRVICWALLLSAPFLVVPVALSLPRSGLSASWNAWVGFGYVSVVSMFLSFFAWYRGLALGGVARIGQLQLLQPILTLLWAALLLGEPIGVRTVFAAFFVIGSAALTQRTRSSLSARPLNKSER
jgi:drug/metabolite transporter (DMT)-like permease